VDGGRAPEPISDHQIQAVARLNRAHRALGQDGTGFTHAFLIARMSIDQICASRGLTSQRENDYIGKRVRECLNTLAVVYGFAMG